MFLIQVFETLFSIIGSPRFIKVVGLLTILFLLFPITPLISSPGQIGIDSSIWVTGVRVLGLCFLLGVFVSFLNWFAPFGFYGSSGPDTKLGIPDPKKLVLFQVPKVCNREAIRSSMDAIGFSRSRQFKNGLTSYTHWAGVWGLWLILSAGAFFLWEFTQPDLLQGDYKLTLGSEGPGNVVDGFQEQIGDSAVSHQLRTPLRLIEFSGDSATVEVATLFNKQTQSGSAKLIKVDEIEPLTVGGHKFFMDPEASSSEEVVLRSTSSLSENVLWRVLVVTLLGLFLLLWRPLETIEVFMEQSYLGVRMTKLVPFRGSSTKARIKEFAEHLEASIKKDNVQRVR